MKKRVLYIVSTFVIITTMALPSCDDCGVCELVTVATDGTISYGTPQFVCGDIYHEYQNSAAN